MVILPLSDRLARYLRKRNLAAAFNKQTGIFRKNPFHPGLNTELLEPKRLRIWSFIISGKYRAIFIWRDNGAMEIIDINNHYH